MNVGDGHVALYANRVSQSKCPSAHMSRFVTVPYRVLVAKSQILLPVALSHFDGIIDILDVHSIVGDVGHAPEATATLQVNRHGGRDTRPHLDTGTVLQTRLLNSMRGNLDVLPLQSWRAYRSIEHGNVVNEDILHNVDLPFVLSEGSNRDTVRAVAVQVLNEDVGRVGLERDTVYN